MARFVFATAKAKFPVPDGESRIGSDSDCPVCVRGEGILPLHAHLKSEGDNLLIRPVSAKATLMVDGKTAAGPIQLKKGQTITLGQVELKLEPPGLASNMVDIARRIWQHWAFRLPLYSACFLLASVLIIRYFVIDEAWWKDKIGAWVKQNFNRDETEIEHVEAEWLAGKLIIKNLRVRNKDVFSDEDYLFKVDNVQITLNSWKLFKSWFHDYSDCSMVMISPQVLIERKGSNELSVTNIDDITKAWRVTDWKKKWKGYALTAFQTDLHIKQGTLRMRDTFAELPDSSLTGIDLKLTQPGFGERMVAEFSANTLLGLAPNEKKGSVQANGWLDWVDTLGQVEAKDLGSGHATLNLKRFDLARLCRHLEWYYPLYDEKQTAVKLVPGKPVTGTFFIDSTRGQTYRIRGDAQSESLVSVIEKGKPPVGNIPTRLEKFDLTFDRIRGPTRIRMRLLSTKDPEQLTNDAAPKLFDFEVNGERFSGGGYSFSADLFAPLHDLFATDVGQRLNLKDQFRGPLKIHAETIKIANNEIEVRAESSLGKSAQVYVRTEPGQPGVWQPLTFDANLRATVYLNEKGQRSGFKVSRFEAKAESFLARSVEPYNIEVKDLDSDKVSARARFHLNLRGKEFWTEFAPLLGLLGFEKPIQEIFDLNVSVVSGTDMVDQPNQSRISIGFEGTATRQWGTPVKPEDPVDPKPVQLIALFDYYPTVFSKYRKRTFAKKDNTLYSMKCMLQAGAEKTPIFIRTEDLKLFYFKDKIQVKAPSLKVHSDINALRKRFRPYLKRFAGMIGEDIYRSYQLAGYLEQSGSLVLTSDLNKGIRNELTVDFNLGIEGKDLALEGPLPHNPKKIWLWSEPKPVVTLGGRFINQASGNPEVGDTRLLDLNSFSMKGRLGEFQCSGKQINLWLLEKLATRVRLPGKHWLDAANSFTFSGSVTPEAFDLLRTLERLPSSPEVKGRLQMDLNYNRKEDAITLKNLEFDQPQNWWLQEMKVEAQVRNIRELFTTYQPGRELPLKFLGKHLVIRSMLLDTKACMDWIAAFPDQAAQFGLTPEHRKALLSKVFIPKGIWTIRDMILHPNKKQSWTLVGNFQNDFSINLANKKSKPPTPDLPKEDKPELKPDAGIQLNVKGPWSIKENAVTELVLGDDFKSVSVFWRSSFDHTALSLKGAVPGWNYEKAAGTPLNFNLNCARSSIKDKDILYLVENLTVVGGPLQMALSGLEVRTRPSPGAIPEQLASLRLTKPCIFTGGPLPCTFERLQYTQTTQRISGLLKSKRVDLDYLTSQAIANLQISLKGSLVNTLFSFDANLDRLRTGLLIKGKDRFKLDGQMENVTLRGRRSNNEEIMLHVNGQYNLGPDSLAFNKLGLAIWHARPATEKTPSRSITHRFSCPSFSLTNTDPKDNILKVLREKPQSIRLKAPLVFETEFNGQHLLSLCSSLINMLETRKTSKSPTTPTSISSSQILNLLLAMQIPEASLQAPVLRLGALQIEKPSIPKFSLKDRILTIPTAKGTFAGGAATLTNASYDLGRASLKHKQSIELEGCQLSQLLGLAKGPYAGFRFTGNLGLTGDLSGNGLNPKDRLSWKGGWVTELSGFSTLAPPMATTKFKALPSWFENLPPAIQLGVAQQSHHAQMPLKLLFKGNESMAQQLPEFNGMLLALHTMLARLGVESKTLEFKKCRLPIEISNGALNLVRARLVGKGPSEGLELVLSGRLQLTEDIHELDLRIWPARLPKAALDKLHLHRWSENLRRSFQRALSEGKLALTFQGPLNQLRCTFPMDPLQQTALRVLFNRERIATASDLKNGLVDLKSIWGGTEPGKKAASEILDRVGLALPGTATARLNGRHMFSDLKGLSDEQQKTFQDLEEAAPVTPLKALKRMLNPPAIIVPKKIPDKPVIPGLGPRAEKKETNEEGGEDHRPKVNPVEKE